jgi:hypothetical protein
MLDAPTRKAVKTAKAHHHMLHGGPSSFDTVGVNELASELHDLNPDAKMMFGVGVDGWTNAVKSKDPAFVRLIDNLCKQLVFLGGNVVIWDQEGQGERNPLDAERVAEICIGVARDHGLVQGFTSFDAPLRVENWGGHSRLPYKKWCGPGGVDIWLPQIYEPNKENTSTGPLANRHRKGQLSWELCKERGIFREDLLIYPYLQVHSTPWKQTVTLGAQYKFQACWAAPMMKPKGGSGRMDSNGVVSVQCLSKLAHFGFTGQRDSIAQFQRTAHITVDNLFGSESLLALYPSTMSAT